MLFSCVCNELINPHPIRFLVLGLGTNFVNRLFMMLSRKSISAQF